jgi:hypothetical protein
MPNKPISKSDAEHINPNLPPPGHERQEELKRRQDALDAEAQALKDDPHPSTFVGNADALKEDREIQNILEKKKNLNPVDPYDFLAVENAQPNRHYVRAYMRGNGFQINGLKMRGYKLVSGNDPEDPALKDVNGHRQLGDTLLMYCSLEDYSRELERQALSSQAASDGVQNRMSALQEHTARASDGRLAVHAGNANNPDEHLHATMDIAAQRAANSR